MTTIYQALCHKYKTNNPQPYISDAQIIADAMPLARSIDTFIHQRKDERITELSKLAIVRSILSAEKSSMLSFEQTHEHSNIDFDSLNKKGTWYPLFFQQLVGLYGKDELPQRFQKVTLIIFNYDRCVEHFLYNALIQYFRGALPNNEALEKAAADLVREITIYHPYGRIAPLPTMEKGQPGFKFGGEPDHRKILELADNIKTFTENVDEGNKIREEIRDATKLIFLGFSFDSLNMELLTPKEPNVGHKQHGTNVLATRKSLSNADAKVVEYSIYNIYEHVKTHVSSVEMSKSDQGCFEFYNEFSRSLSF